MARTYDFKVITFEQLKRDCSHETDHYEPSWDQAKGVIRMGCGWGKRLGAERGDLLKVASCGRSAVYTLKMSPHLAEDTIALDYDQQKQLDLLDLKGAAPITIRRAGRFGTYHYLWKHVDPAIRLPFKISIGLMFFGLVAGAAAAPMLINSMDGLASAAKSTAALIDQNLGVASKPPE